MSYPKIKFKVNAKKDFETLLTFIDEAKFDEGRNLQWLIFEKYPQWKKYFNLSKYVLIDRIKLKNEIFDLYTNNSERFSLLMLKHEVRWRKIEKNFYNLVNALFCNHQWPKGKYIAFGTIWGMYPRFLDDKTFQIPYKHKKIAYVPVVIAHEMLHFVFYDYFFLKYPQYKKSKYNFFVWYISEVFNSLVQNTKKWLSVFGEKSLVYPEHQEIVDSLKIHVDDDNKLNIDQLLDKIIIAVKSNENFSNIK